MYNRLNVHISLLLLLFGLLMSSSCSINKNLRSTESKDKDELVEKSVEIDTTIIMPPSVDVSNYEPEYIRKEKKRKAKSKEAKLRNKMVIFSKKFIGIPYKYAGKKPSTGFDCSGFTCYIYKEFDLPLTSGSRYQAKEGKKIAVKKTEPGDLIIFGKGNTINHVAMVIENSKKGLFVIHSTNRGVVIDNILENSYWKPRILYARKIVGL